MASAVAWIAAAASPSVVENHQALCLSSDDQGEFVLIEARKLNGYQLASIDGSIGCASEFLFDDRYWAIRYLVANTGRWLSGKQVLLSPYSVSAVDTVNKTVSIVLTKKQIEGSPSIKLHAPVSRQFEGSYYEYYGYPPYWSGSWMCGSSPHLERRKEKWNALDQTSASWDRHLRSTRQVAGYCIVASDGEIGHVVDFMVDEDTWAIRYLVVATANFWPGKQVLLSPHWITSVSWETQEVMVDLSREAIKKSPAYVEAAAVTRAYETDLFGHYNRDGYWVAGVTAA
jgi:hypothetical protein